MRPIFPSHNYEEALQKTKLPTLAARMEQLCRDYFNKVRTEGNKLHGLLPDARHVPYSLRAMNDYPVLKVRTNRFGISFIPRGLCNAQWFYSILLLFYCAIKVWVRFGKCLGVSMVRECKSNFAIAKIKSYLIL